MPCYGSYTKTRAIAITRIYPTIRYIRMYVCLLFILYVSNANISISR